MTSEEIRNVFLEVGLNLEVEIFSRSRKRKHHYAQIAGVKICMDKINSLPVPKSGCKDDGLYGYSMIGRVLNKSHATVMRQYQNHEILFKYADYRDVYFRCKNPSVHHLINPAQRDESLITC